MSLGEFTMDTTMLRRLTCALLAASLSFASVPGSVFAQEIGEKVEQLSQDGAKLYRAGDYQGAARKFEAAYELEPVPNLLFNAAKCYEKLEQWDNSIALYKKFSVAPDVDPKAKDLALQQIQAIKEIQEIDERGKNDAKVADSNEEKTKPDENTEPPSPPPIDYTWAYVSLGTGVALLATGGIFGVLASAEQSNFDVAETSQERRTAADSGTTFALTADILYGLGAAAAITGVILFVTADSDEAAEPGVSWTPIVGPDNVGVGMTGRF
jgi:tetratricopeptide (TPR) repeat protein